MPFATLGALILLQASPSVEVTVVTPEGRPVSGAVVGNSFSFAAPSGQPKVQIGYGEPGRRTNAQGRARLLREDLYNASVVAMDGNRRLGVAALGNGNSVRIVVRPAREAVVTAPLPRPLTRQDVAREQISLQVQYKGQTVGYATLPFGSTRLQLPSSGLEIVGFHTYCSEATVSVPSGTGRRQITLQFRVSPWVNLRGKPVSFAFGSASTAFNPAQLKGRWVLLDFWATWCAPCVSKFNDYIRFVERSTAQADRFAIVAMHSPDAESYAETRSALEGLRASKWGGKAPNFPLLFDPKGVMVKRFGVNSYPSSFLIDPQGRLVGLGSLEELQRRLRTSR